MTLCTVSVYNQERVMVVRVRYIYVCTKFAFFFKAMRNIFAKFWSARLVVVVESKSQTSYINSRPIIFKVQLFWKGHKNLKKSPTCFDAKLLSKNSCFAKTGGLFFQIVWPSHKVLTLHVSRKNINIVANPFTKILFDFKLHNYGYSWINTYIRK